MHIIHMTFLLSLFIKRFTPQLLNSRYAALCCENLFLVVIVKITQNILQVSRQQCAVLLYVRKVLGKCLQLLIDKITRGAQCIEVMYNCTVPLAMSLSTQLHLLLKQALRN
jgi:hypothetical protein